MVSHEQMCLEPGHLRFNSRISCNLGQYACGALLALYVSLLLVHPQGEVFVATPISRCLQKVILAGRLIHGAARGVVHHGLSEALVVFGVCLKVQVVEIQRHFVHLLARALLPW